MYLIKIYAESLIKLLRESNLATYKIVIHINQKDFIQKCKICLTSEKKFNVIHLINDLKEKNHMTLN